MITLSNPIAYNALTVKNFAKATGVTLQVEIADNLHFYSMMDAKWNPNVEGHFEPETITWAIYNKKTRNIVASGKTVAVKPNEYCFLRGDSQRGRKWAKFYDCKKVADNKKPLVGDIEICTILNQYLTK